MTRARLTAVWMLLLAGCSSVDGATTEPDGGTTPTEGGATDAATPQDGGAADGAAASPYTLESCTTDIAADVPTFYRTYFKCVTIVTTADGVSITWNGLPPHPSYYYGQGHPNYAAFDVTRGSQYKANPNKIVARTKTMTVPSAPVSRGLTITSDMVDRTVNTNAAEYRGGAVGVAIDSVSIFNDQAGPGDDIDNERFTFDSYEGHPPANGEYHYHTASPGPLEVLKSLGKVTTTTPGQASLEVYGIMCDGTVVLGCTELDGSAPDGAGLDAQNGHVGDLRDSGGVVHFSGRYHTHVCPKLFAAHPYTPEIQSYSTCTLR